MKKIVFISHPIGGDVTSNLAKLLDILRDINLNQPDIVPVAPYFADVMCLEDTVPAERRRGLSNAREMLESCAFDEIWLYGDTVTPGMLTEVNVAKSCGIDICPKTEGALKWLMDNEVLFSDPSFIF